MRKVIRSREKEKGQKENKKGKPLGQSGKQNKTKNCTEYSEYSVFLKFQTRVSTSPSQEWSHDLLTYLDYGRPLQRPIYLTPTSPTLPLVSPTTFTVEDQFTVQLTLPTNTTPVTTRRPTLSFSSRPRPRTWGSLTTPCFSATKTLGFHYDV